MRLSAAIWNLLLLGSGRSAAPLTYAGGPGDIVAGATAWYGLRAYSAAQATGTQKAINIRRASDNNTLDILILPNGNLDVATATTFLAATTGFVTMWYDQTGNGNHAVQATSALQPAFTFARLGALPCVTATGTQFLVSPTSAINQPMSVSSVSARTGNFTAYGTVISAAAGGPFYGNTANTIQAWLGTFGSATALDSTPHAIQLLASGASSVFNVDGAETSVSIGALAYGANASLFAQSGGVQYLTGYIAEAGLWPVGFTAPQRTALQANQRAYWFGSYVGPGDLTPGATAWYGLRAYNAAYAASSGKAINIRRASDSTTLDINVLPNGNLDVATATTFLAATTGFVTTWYDQTGNGWHAVQATAANQPQLTLSGIGSRPCLTYTGAHYNVSSSPVVNQPFSMAIVAARDGNFAAFGIPFAGGAEMEFFNSANTWSMYAGSRTGVTASDTVAHSAIAVFNGASPNSMLGIDGAVTTVSPGAGTVSGVTIGAQPAGTFPITGRIAEAGLWPSALSAGNQSAIQANQKTYWGTP